MMSRIDSTENRQKMTRAFQGCVRKEPIWWRRRESKTVLRENSEETSETTQAVAPDPPASPPVVSQSCPIPENSPERLAALHADLAETLRVGDIAAARMAHEALGRLLEEDGEPADVVDLAVARAKRARS